MPTESGIILPADSTGKALRSETVTTAFVSGSGGVVHQQVVTIGDPTTPANVATVDAEGALTVVPRGGVRHLVNFTAQTLSVPASSAEALVSLAQSTDTATASSATSYTVTSGKTLRLQGIVVTGVVLATTASPVATGIRLRAAVSGSLTTSSPIQWSGRLGPPLGTGAANYGLQPLVESFGIDGIELPASSVFGVSTLSSSTTGAMHAVDIAIFGYEYP